MPKNLKVKNLSYECKGVGKTIKSSKKYHRWEFVLDGKFRLVELYNSKVSHKCRLTLDGRLLVEQSDVQKNFTYHFKIDNHKLCVSQLGSDRFELLLGEYSFTMLLQMQHSGIKEDYEEPRPKSQSTKPKPRPEKLARKSPQKKYEVKEYDANFFLGDENEKKMQIEAYNRIQMNNNNAKIAMLDFDNILKAEPKANEANFFSAENMDQHKPVSQEFYNIQQNNQNIFNNFESKFHDIPEPPKIENKNTFNLFDDFPQNFSSNTGNQNGIRHSMPQPNTLHQNFQFSDFPNSNINENMGNLNMNVNKKSFVNTESQYPEFMSNMKPNLPKIEHNEDFLGSNLGNPIQQQPIINQPLSNQPIYNQPQGHAFEDNSFKANLQNSNLVNFNDLLSNQPMSNSHQPNPPQFSVNSSIPMNYMPEANNPVYDQSASNYNPYGNPNQPVTSNVSTPFDF